MKAGVSRERRRVSWSGSSPGLALGHWPEVSAELGKVTCIALFKLGYSEAGRTEVIKECGGYIHLHKRLGEATQYTKKTEYFVIL